MGKTVFRGSFCGEAATRASKTHQQRHRDHHTEELEKQDRRAAVTPQQEQHGHQTGEGQQQEPAVCGQNGLRMADQVGQRADCCPDQGGEQCTDQIFYRPGRKGKPC